MQLSDGYVDSQTWQAWKESFTVMYGNVSMVLVVSVMASIAAVAAVYFLPSAQATSTSTDDKKKSKEKHYLTPIENKLVTNEKLDAGANDDMPINRVNAINTLLKDAKGCIFARTAKGLAPHPVELHTDEITSPSEKEDNDIAKNEQKAYKQPPPTVRLSPFYQRKEEEVKEQQLSTIFQLMKEQEEKFGDTSMTDLQSQLKLYSS